ncbi:site-specific DNA-methyltransferase [Paenibacillus campinasensis]|uniref:Site-specific DNA-methyltransferase (Adenine-specific) n=1 Tax=Paenibacillus campinasensis TaxID=66347 RepID=A0A268ETC1_9BACL|nr:site-specific DNA-methyltransferase [Paenibacillus campinasensis]PAD76378.1 site-specific DNA-methyltransferase (adenine-specific) [Paenibacillus campinasensis]
MPNLSQIKRQRMLEFLNKIREEHNDDASLIAINEIETELFNKKFGLVWEEHEERVDIEMLTKVPVFSEVVDREIVSDKNLPYNFLLEGDNLHSLKLLVKTHKGNIDLIYIDPPYNTGNEDFMYEDDYVNEDDGFRHSKWLSFMDERLRLARDLLTEEGALFIQISDIELAQLKLLCDDVFGENNFLNIISVNMKNIAGASGGGEDKRFKKNCEYILIYAKNYSALPIFNGAYVYTEMSELIKTYIEEGVSWKYTSVLLYEGDKEYIGSTVDGDGNDIKVYLRKNPVIKSIKQVAKSEGISEQEAYKKYGTKIFQTTNAQSSIRTRVMSYRTEQGISEDLLSIEYVPKTGRNKGKVYEQFYKGDKCRLFVWLKDTSEEIDGVLYKKDLQGTYWDYTGQMKNLTKEGNVEFNNGKKPLELVKRIISLYPSKDITVLDFFAGSGTTGHAVISQNAEDDGTRKFILCTNNEGNICEEVTYKRLSNVIYGYTTDSGKVFEPNPVNLKYYKTGFIEKYSDDLDYSVNDELLKHIAEMVQLEYAVSLDDSKYILLMSDEEADAFILDNNKLQKCKGLFLSSAVLLTSEQTRKLTDSGINTYIIPDYYFESELLEVGER